MTAPRRDHLLAPVSRLLPQLAVDEDWELQGHRVHQFTLGKSIFDAAADGARLAARGLGITGLAIANASRWGAALSQLWHFAELTSLPLRGHAEQHEGAWQIHLFPRFVMGGHALRYWTLFTVAFLDALSWSLCAAPAQVARLTLPFDRSADDDLVTGLGGAVEFDQPALVIQLVAGEEDLPIDTADPMTFRFAVDQLEQTLELRRRTASLPALLWGSMVRRADMRVTLDELATDLGISSRTLQRRIADNGTSFSALIAQIRRLQVLMLVSERMPAKKIAFRAGIDVSSVYRYARLA